MCKFYELWSLFLYRFEIYIIYDLYIYEPQSFLYQESRRQSLNSAAPYQTIRALLRHTAYQCELHFRKDLNVVIRLI